MAAAELPRAPVTCPHCGHTQLEPEAVISTVCRRCRGAIRVREDAGAAPLPRRRFASLAEAKPSVEAQELECFQCGTLLTVPRTAESTMCKRCSSHMDLRDYVINQAVSKNFRTHGRFVVGGKGYVFNTDSLVGEAVLKGRYHGRLVARRRLEVHTSAEIRGSFETKLLVIPAGQVFAWSQPVKVENADISGELSASVRIPGSLWLRAGAKLFGDVEAAHFIVEAGAVVVGHLHVGDALSRRAGVPLG